MPFVLGFLVVGIVVILAGSSSWIGKLATEGPPKVDPMEKMTYTEARTIVETELNSGLAACGATNTKLSWADPNTSAPGDKNTDTPLALTVDTTLPNTEARKPIIDKVKDYMEKGKIPTLTMNDSASHAHWTYNMVAPLQSTNADE